MTRAELSQCDVLVIARDAAGLFAAYDCARIGLLTEVWVVTGGFLAETFSHRGGVVAQACEEFQLEYLVHRPDRDDESVAGIPVNAFTGNVLRKIGWRGAWRMYADRIMPVFKIGNETRLERLVSKRLGSQVLSKIVNPRLQELYGKSARELSVDAVAPGLAQAMTRAGSLTGGVLELIVQDPRHAQTVTIAAGSTKEVSPKLGDQNGESTLMAKLRTALEYFSAVVRDVDASTIDIELYDGPGSSGGEAGAITVTVKGRRKLLRPRLVMGFEGLDVPAELQSSHEPRIAVVGKKRTSPGLESAIPASRESSLHLRTELFANQQKPPIGSASIQE